MRTYLDVPYEQKDAAKRAGARWDGERKRWYVQDMEKLGPVMRWMPRHLLMPAKKPLSKGAMLR